jgi:hypothetical protein
VVSKSHWILFAGRGAYKLMKDVGLTSILELTPNGIEFDSIPNHEERYMMQLESIIYLEQHPEILNSSKANKIVDMNYMAFHSSNEFVMPLVNKLDEILEKHK